MQYILKDGKIINDIPIGRSSVKIGEINEKGTLEVIARAEGNTASNGVRVICKCVCGNYTVLALNAFRNGSTFSCGCLGLEIHREACRKTGQRSKTKDYTIVDNPFYNFIEQLPKKDNCNSFFWTIECKKCKKRYEAVPAQVVSYKRKNGVNPCDCNKQISIGAFKIKTILDENNIPYEQEKKFDTCLSPKGNKLKFDFYINNQYLLEYDGEQHFKPECFHSNVNGEEKLKLQQEYDIIKNEWCKNNNIKLIRIPYTELANFELKDLLLETSSFIME